MADGATDATDIGRYGAYYDIELKEGAESFGFLFVNKQGEGQTSDYTFDKINQFNHLFIKHGDPTIYPHPFGSMPLSLHSGELLSDKKLRLVFQNGGTRPMELLNELTIKDKEGREITLTKSTIVNAQRVEVEGEFN